MERARELIEPYLEMDGVIGIYLLGSATRPFRDRLSDYDIEVVVEDAVYRSLPDEKKHVFVIDEGPPRRVDHEFYLRPWSEFERLVDSTQDLFHYPYQHAVILHDPDGKLAAVIHKLAELPEDVRRVRMRVHYLEFFFGVKRAEKTLARNGVLNTHLLVGEAMVALVKLLFLQQGSWPATRHWSAQELRTFGIPEDLLSAIENVFSFFEKGALEVLIERVHQWLDDQGVEFHRDYMGLVRWAFLSDKGKRAFQEWGAR